APHLSQHACEQHPAIIAAWQQGATRYGVGAGGSGHVSGYSEAHRALEEALADWLGYPRGTEVFGFVTTGGELLNALIMFCAPAIVNRIGAKNA
ncbi:MFS transporter, partial [Klebsiella pneumoniae]|uniref:MFS transporter n=1 Tax=Klebsiella pneumoniae TaxID=573 RepID=UPI00210E2B00